VQHVIFACYFFGGFFRLCWGSQITSREKSCLSIKPLYYRTMPADSGTPCLEIVGLHANSNGRSCCQHHCCGEHVQVGDVLRLVRCIVTIHSQPEEAVKLVKIADGTNTCTVGFVPRVFSKMPHVEQHINKFVQVVELYTNSGNTYKNQLSTKNSGMASVVCLDDIPIPE
jgi:hypothetical protein